jgi:hypothetical protein
MRKILPNICWELKPTTAKNVNWVKDPPAKQLLLLLKNKNNIFFHICLDSKHKAAVVQAVSTL